MRFKEFGIPLNRGGDAIVEHVRTSKPEKPVFASVGIAVDRTDCRVFREAAKRLNETHGAGHILIEPDPNDVTAYTVDGHVDPDMVKVVIAGSWAQQERPELLAFWEEVSAIRLQEQS